jgi:uncharacterized damage-inducible protein DinB
VLGELRSAVRRLTAAEYGSAPAGGASGSIGSHVRHCLDHVSALRRGLESGVVDYDERTRGTLVERSRTAGLEALEAARRQVSDIEDAVLDREVAVRAQLDRNGFRIETRSTVGRELAFVVSHTIHHSATIRVLMERRGHDVRPHFGFAASTPLGAVTRSCALSA